MSRFTRGKRRKPQGDPEVAEDPEVRQYRYLLRTAPADALEAAHGEAIPMLTAADQESLVETMRASLLAGDHLTRKEPAKIAHRLTLGEKRTPGQLLSALPPDVLRELATKVLESEASFGLLSGYAAWDGNEPSPADDSAWADAGFTPQGSRLNPHRGHDQSGFVPESGGGGA